MAGFADGENNFSDDDLDDLPVNALQELENNAIQLTQAQLKAPPSSDYGDEFDDEDLDDAVVIDEARSAPAVVSAYNRKTQSEADQREHFRQQRYGAPKPANQARPNPPAFNHPHLAPSTASIQVQHQETTLVQRGSLPESDGNLDNLQKQILELIKERDGLKDDLNSKAGEIAIVRSKQDKAAKEHERQMITIQKLNEEKLAKQQRALEAARIAQQQIATEREFLKQDLSEEARARRLRAREAAEKRDNGGLATPKKKKPLAHRDGFDDDEIQIVSPSKVSPSRFLKKPGTPSKTAKRKRKAVESPVAPLEMTSFEESFTEEAKQKATELDEASLARLVIHDDRFDFIGTMLDYQPRRDQLRTIEELGKHALPSTPKESFQSIILGSLPSLGLKRPISGLAFEFCELLISLWTSCLQEEYYKAIYLFVDMLTLALELKTTSIAPHVMNSLVPLIQETIHLVAFPRFKNAKPREDLDKAIDSCTCLNLLHLEALGCMSEEKHITSFWRLVTWNFVMMMLSNNHTPLDYEIMLNILSTSVLRDSFGPITDDAEIWMYHIIYRLTYPLYQVPPKPLSPEKMESSQLRKLQLQILYFITGMTRSPFASTALAADQNAVARLVILMSNEFDALYDYKSGHEDSAKIITMSLRLLYHLIITHEGTIDVSDKLSVISGGMQKYQLCLARLNFFDDGVLDAGIGSDVPMLALELLEGVVTMEEGDAIHEAFPSI